MAGPKRAVLESRSESIECDEAGRAETNAEAPAQNPMYTSLRNES